MTRLSVRAVTKAFAGAPVLRGIDLDVPDGGLTAILGPSGCGKTTLLRLVVGFDVPDSGTITIDGRRVSDGRHGLPPERRGVGYLAQEGALFPHLSVAANITFGLPRAARRDRRRVAELLDLVGLEARYAPRHPHQLSGGQQQRVALARALAPRPSLVLLDEPFAALDAALRAETRATVLAALAASGTTAVLVTHDQSEALSVAHQVAVMRDGVLVQTAAPADLYTTPADVAVAGFVGDAVLLAAAGEGGAGCAQCALGVVPVRGPDPVGAVTLMLRPEQVRVHADGCACGCGGGDGSGGVPARVEGRTYYGHDATVQLRLTGSDTRVTARCAGGALPRPTPPSPSPSTVPPSPTRLSRSARVRSGRRRPARFLRSRRTRRTRRTRVGRRDRPGPVDDLDLRRPCRHAARSPRAHRLTGSKTPFDLDRDPTGGACRWRWVGRPCSSRHSACIGAGRPAVPRWPDPCHGPRSSISDPTRGRRPTAFDLFGCRSPGTFPTQRLTLGAVRRRGQPDG